MPLTTVERSKSLYRNIIPRIAFAFLLLLYCHSADASPKAIDLLANTRLDTHEPNYCNETELIASVGLLRSPSGQFLGYPCSNEFFHCRWQSDGYRTYKKNCRIGLVYDTLGTQNCNYDYNVKGCAIQTDAAKCKEKDFSCPLSESCVTLAQRCDGKYDCVLEEDEQNCPMCRAGEFPCVTSEQCIPMSGRCNGVQECQDGTDEHDCDDCGAGKFFCRKSGKCIAAKERCDGTTQCPHGEDEFLCKKSTLRMYVCETRKQQVPRESVCDGVVNCPDGSDEKYCNRQPAATFFAPPLVLPISADNQSLSLYSDGESSGFSSMSTLGGGDSTFSGEPAAGGNDTASAVDVATETSVVNHPNLSESEQAAGLAGTATTPTTTIDGQSGYHMAQGFSDDLSAPRNDAFPQQQQAMAMLSSSGVPTPAVNGQQFFQQQQQPQQQQFQKVEGNYEQWNGGADAPSVAVADGESLTNNQMTPAGFAVAPHVQQSQASSTMVGRQSPLLSLSSSTIGVANTNALSMKSAYTAQPLVGGGSVQGGVYPRQMLNQQPVVPPQQQYAMPSAFPMNATAAFFPRPNRDNSAVGGSSGGTPRPFDAVDTNNGFGGTTGFQKTAEAQPNFHGNQQQKQSASQSDGFLSSSSAAAFHPAMSTGGYGSFSGGQSLLNGDYNEFANYNGMLTAKDDVLVDSNGKMWQSEAAADSWPSTGKGGNSQKVLLSSATNKPRVSELSEKKRAHLMTLNVEEALPTPNVPDCTFNEGGCPSSAAPTPYLDEEQTILERLRKKIGKSTKELLRHIESTLQNGKNGTAASQQ